jgi:hypothetical protein
MTRQDYEAVAKAIRNYLDEPDLKAHTQENRIRRDTVDDILDVLADVFKADNKSFDACRFISACIPN